MTPTCLRQALVVVLLPMVLGACGAGCVGECVAGPAPLPQVRAVTISPTSAVLNIGGTATLSATVSADTGLSTTVTWTSNNSNVASVSQAGVVTAVSAGQAIVTATSVANSKFSAAATITVNPCSVRGVTVNPGTASLKVGGPTLTLSPTVDADACASRTVTWSSSNTAVATVNGSGVATAVAAGNATITATSVADGSRRGTVSVTVSDPCSARKPYTLAATQSGTVTTASCYEPVIGEGDWYSYTTTAATTFVLMRFTSSVFPPAAAPVFAGGGFWHNSLTARGSLDLYVLAKAGTFGMFAGTADTTVLGAYTITSFLNPVLPACTSIYSTTGVTGSFAINTSSCVYTPQGLTGTFYTQRVNTNAPIGATIKVTVTSTQFSPLIELRDGGTGALLASSSSQTGSTVSATFTTNGTTFAPAVFVTSRVAAQTGSFTITIDP